ncbi:LysR family transcriptional regulator [Rhodopseudomonas pseudopalustris]|uniref:Transcriptional regulator, LysR family n=1 Tax=Rhodopseudomonas pseudopalustris TaxID=1513892 RepID=A0A1H8RVZ2_9BRAD|nr:LysR family transcriptional regulator [Rhodopseudomonas pseudopalustris]SEO70819.1 transcriptional regulator, LysR family [Rhodopseudomonas pseudopalustris]
MTLEQLRIFIAVAEQQHMTRAASGLNLTQSAASAAIAALESRYDVKLFNRVGRGIALTQAGREFLDEARAVVARARAAAKALDDLAGLKRGALSLAVSQTIGNYWLPPRLLDFQRTYPGIELQVSITNTEQVARAVREGRADLGLVEGEVDDSSLASRRIDGDSLAVVVGKRHPWVGQTRISASKLTTTGWVLRERGSGTRSMFEAALHNAGVDPSHLDVKLELPSNEAVRTAIECSDYAAAISDLVAAPSLAAATLHRVQFDLPRRSFFVLRHKEHSDVRPVNALLKSLQTE